MQNWIKCKVNGDLVNLTYVEEIEINRPEGAPPGPHFELQVVFAHPTQQKTKKRKAIYVGTHYECEKLLEKIQEHLHPIII